jgi:hypothetical protein
MADIKVERKGPSIWPWIVGLVVLALLVWALMQLFGRKEPGEVKGQPVATAPLAAPLLATRV